jgi:hypothetical protein
MVRLLTIQQLNEFQRGSIITSAMTLTRPGTKLSQLSCAVVLLLVIGTLAWRAFHRPEPRYAGKGLRAWLNDYCTAEYEGDQEDARQAIQRIGTNAIPCLLEMLSERDSRFTATLDSVLQRHGVRIPLGAAGQHRTLAIGGFRALRSTARPATPDLVRLVGDGEDIAVRVAALRSLGFIQPVGRQAASSITACLNDSNLVVRLYAAEAASEIEFGPRAWFPKGSP